MRSSFAYPGGYHTSAFWPRKQNGHRYPDRRGVKKRHRIDALHHIQRGRCYLCGEPFGGKRTDMRVTRDHVRPVSRGGSRWLLAHERCNVKKGKRNPKPCELIYLEGAYTILAKMTAVTGLRRGLAPARGDPSGFPA